MVKSIRCTIILSSILVAFLLIPESAQGQYFGRNRVQYEDFNYKVLETQHFNIYHYPREERATRDLGRLAERWYQRHSAMLGHQFETRNPLIIYANHADFQQNNIIPRVSVGTGGVTEGLRNRVLMPFSPSNASTSHVLGHELVHAFQYDIARRDAIGGIRATSQLPVWFIEGMAEYLSVGAEDTHTAMWLRDAVLNDDMPSISDLTNTAEYFPYRFGHSVWTYITGRWGDEIVPELYINTAKNGFRKGFRQTLGIPVDSVSTLWNNAVAAKYGTPVQRREKPSETGRLVRGSPDKETGINVAPSLGPNGEQVAFISRQSLFSLELFLADAETGEIIRKLTSTVSDPHLSAIRFIESAGTWSPDGRRFAAVVFAKGDNRIAIIDTREGGITRRIGFGEVDALTNPAWSPGGRYLAFSGSDGGYSDLYLYDMRKDSLRNLTQDAYSYLQPAWSPDGSRLAFVTDRGPGTDIENMTFGNMQIGILDLDSGQRRMVPEFEDAKHINPKFNEDGSALYYISDFRGYSDVFRYDLENGGRSRVTRTATGISGISEYSPAMTVAADSGDMMVTVFNNGNYSLYSIPEEKRAGRPIGQAEGRNSAQLPPADPAGNRVTGAYMEAPFRPIPSDTALGYRDYKPTLLLSSVNGAGGVGISSRLGVGTAGGINLGFSDMLNQHQLLTSLRFQGKIQDISGEIAYLNQDGRMSWGGTISHRVFRTSSGAATVDTATIGGERVPLPTIKRFTRRTFQDRVAALGYYPFSSTQRMEATVSYTRISYDLELQNNFYDPSGSRIIDRTTEELDAPDPLNLYSASLGYVEDNSISAYTGPVRGHRMRLEAEPTVGAVNYVNALADYRRYFYMRPLTLAFRALHTGRYFQGPEGKDLSPNFIGYGTLVRGYNPASFEPGECEVSRQGACPTFDRLVGSRMGVANLELRLPVLGAEQLSLFRSNTIPTTLSAFVDGGVAWSAGEPPTLKWATDTDKRVPVFSSGLSVRVNVLGYLVAELYYAVPFQRPEKSGYVGFQISPGF